jgi:hypothetical protein
MKTTMQIVLVQTEVEDALKEYVHKRVTVPTDTHFEIDISSTRGSEGVKAIIDLVPASTTGPKVITAGRKRLTVPATQTPVPATKEPEPEPEAEPAQEPAEPQEPQTEESEEVAEATGTEDAVSAATEPPPPAAPVKSLFANLRKPQNG